MKIIKIHYQRGTTLVIGLIMLMITSMMVVTNFNMVNTNLLAVGNMQFQNEAIAAVNLAIEEVISTFTTTQGEQIVPVDLNNDGIIDYTATIAAPPCYKAKQVVATCTGCASSASLKLILPYLYNTAWELIATVTDINTGANVTIHTGVRVTLTQTQYDDVCT